MSPSLQGLLKGLYSFWGLSQAQNDVNGDAQTSLWSGSHQAKQPNFIFVLTDDQDLHMGSVDYMPLLQHHLIDKGTFYKRHFVTTAVCCPARVSLWTGKAAHNTNVTDVFPPYGGYPKFISEGHNDAYLPVFLQEAGYNTYYTGKLFNAHTVDNYDKPYPRGWTGHDFLLDPWTYTYLNATFQRNENEPTSHDGEYTTDVLAGKALGFLDDALSQTDKPFFLGIAPVAPHSNINLTGKYSDEDFDPNDETKIRAAVNLNLPDFSHGLGATPPVPAARHAHLFPDAKVPRTANFNPDSPSGVSWVHQLPKQSVENVAYNDVFYRARLQALQAVDELVDAVVRRLEEDEEAAANTYIIYTTDNGFHIGQHRLQPGKECGYETDVNIPLIIRGPGVPQAREVTGAVATTHADLTPTLVHLASGELRSDFDGAPIPLTEESLQRAEAEEPGAWHEHVTVEFWGQAASEGKWGFLDNNTFIIPNNTYKSIRVVSNDYDLYYSVWCNNEKELYDLRVDPYQIHNLLSPSSTTATVSGFSVTKLIPRLDALLLVTKTCKGSVCRKPWQSLHPDGDVDRLRKALAAEYDDFYEKEQVRVSFSSCEYGQIIAAEGPQFETDGKEYWHGTRWTDWL